jgi:CRISPR-associated protein Cmr6
MKCPLYKNNSAPANCPNGANTGLWFDKFCNQWRADQQKTGLLAWSLKAFSVGKEENRHDFNPKLDWINTIVKAQNPIGDPNLISEHTDRLDKLARALGGKTIRLKTTSRLATGLGREHPIENGFAWHPILGVPYLPGSSMKGLVRALLEGNWLGQPPDSEAFHRIFGSDFRNDFHRNNRAQALQNQVGSVLFFDALPAEPIHLKLDVMTPHYGDYYGRSKYDGNNLTPPADWLSPNPIHFLTVAPGQLFQFALAPRTRSEQDLGDLDKALEWLQDALIRLGAGAKTAVGYGRFAKPDAATATSHQPAQVVANRPAGHMYKTGQRITVTRVKDPKGKNRAWFQADDGFGGVIPSCNSPPQIEIGQTIELEISSVTQGIGYNFRLPKTADNPRKPKQR